jgi:nitroimidazol reductase NimA-like FMN-containing flavoprotein (pyridoxamine 5'-phosphate oxidase superfamily)
MALGPEAPGIEDEDMTLIENGLEMLSPEQCHELLGRCRVGRVAVTVGALPAIFPVNYAVLDTQIVFLAGEGTKLRAALERAVVAFLVDQTDGSSTSGWSVMVVGLAEEITDPGEIRAAELLDLHPLAAGVRSHFIRIRPGFVSGRGIV